MVTQQDGAAEVAGADKWVTRREVAQLAGCSEDTIKRDVKTHTLETRLSDKGEVLVRVADFVALGRLQPQDVPTGLSAGQAAELKRVLADNVRLAAQVAELTGRLSAATAAQDVVIAQLGVKEAQTQDLLALARAVAGAAPRLAAVGAAAASQPSGHGPWWCSAKGLSVMTRCRAPQRW